MPSAIWRTADGGKSFAHIATGRDALLSMSFLSAHLGYVEVARHSYCPYQPACPEDLLRTTDGGRHFVQVARLPTAAYISSIAFVSRDVGYGLSARCQGVNCRSGVPLWRTTDGGRHWTRVKRPLSFSGSGTIYSAPDGYLAALFSGGFAVLVPSAGWRVVHLETTTQPPVPLNPASVAPGRTKVLVLVGGSGPLLGSYTARRWALP